MQMIMNSTCVRFVPHTNENYTLIFQFGTGYGRNKLAYLKFQSWNVNVNLHFTDAGLLWDTSILKNNILAKMAAVLTKFFTL